MNNFSLRVLLSICFIIYQFQPGVACKSIAYKKSTYIDFLHASRDKGMKEKSTRFPRVMFFPWYGVAPLPSALISVIEEAFCFLRVPYKRKIISRKLRI